MKNLMTEEQEIFLQLLNNTYIPGYDTCEEKELEAVDSAESNRENRIKNNGFDNLIDHTHMQCSECGSKSFSRDGFDRLGEIRYKCKDCGKEITVKGMSSFFRGAQLKYNQWIQLISTMLSGIPITNTATIMNTSNDTVFERRKKIIMSELVKRTQDGTRLHGNVYINIRYLFTTVTPYDSFRSAEKPESNTKTKKKKKNEAEIPLVIIATDKENLLIRQIKKDDYAFQVERILGKHIDREEATTLLHYVPSDLNRIFYDLYPEKIVPHEFDPDNDDNYRFFRDMKPYYEAEEAFISYIYRIANGLGEFRLPEDRLQAYINWYIYSRKKLHINSYDCKKTAVDIMTDLFLSEQLLYQMETGIDLTAYRFAKDLVLNYVEKQNKKTLTVVYNYRKSTVSFTKSYEEVILPKEYIEIKDDNYDFRLYARERFASLFTFETDDLKNYRFIVYTDSPISQDQLSAINTCVEILLNECTDMASGKEKTCFANGIELDDVKILLFSPMYKVKSISQLEHLEKYEANDLDLNVVLDDKKIGSITLYRPGMVAATWQHDNMYCMLQMNHQTVNMVAMKDLVMRFRENEKDLEEGPKTE